MITIKSYGSGSSGNFYIVRNEATAIILECGFESKEIKDILYMEENSKIRDFNACIVSHVHSDHSKCLGYISQYIPIYANAQVQGKYQCDNFHEIGSKSRFKIRTIDIMVLDVDHAKAVCNCFIFHDKDSTIFFGTDFSSTIFKFNNFKFDEIWIECNYVPSCLKKMAEQESEDSPYIRKYQRQCSTHLSLDNCCKLLHEIFNLEKCKKIVGIHVSQDVGDYEIMYERLRSEFPNQEIQLLSKKGEVYRC